MQAVYLPSRAITEELSPYGTRRRNFRKKFFSMDFLIDTGEYEDDVHHRPGRLYRFDYNKYEQNKKKWTGIEF